MPMLVDAIQFVSGPLSLIAFVLLVIAYVKRARDAHERKLIAGAGTEEGKLQLIEAALDRTRRDYKGLSRPQLFQMYTQEIASQDSRFRVQAITLCVLVFIGCTTFAVATIFDPKPSTAQKQKLRIGTKPTAYQDSAQVPLGAEFTVVLENQPADSEIHWKKPLRGTLSALEGNNLRYRATTLGSEKLKAEVSWNSSQASQVFEFIVVEPVSDDID